MTLIPICAECREPFKERAVDPETSEDKQTALFYAPFCSSRCALSYARKVFVRDNAVAIKAASAG